MRSRSEEKNKENPGKDKGTAMLLAVLFGFFTWLYTYHDDGTKFCVGLLANVFLFWTIIVPVVIWIWAIIDTATKDKKWYSEY